MQSRHRAHFSKGFTLIELMIVIAIVAILVAMAVPAYRDYVVRSKITECINLASVAKLQVSEYRMVMGAWPPSLADAGIDGSGDTEFCNGFTSGTNGAFGIDVDEAALEDGIAQIEPVLTPEINASGSTIWKCSIGNTAAASVKYLPSTCRNT